MLKKILFALFSISCTTIYAEFDAYVDIVPLSKSTSGELQILLTKEFKKGWFGSSYEQYINPRVQVIINAESGTKEADNEIQKKAVELLNAFEKKNDIDLGKAELKEVIKGEMFGTFSEIGTRKKHYVFILQAQPTEPAFLSPLKWINLNKILHAKLPAKIDSRLKQILSTKEFHVGLEELRLIPKSPTRDLKKALEDLTNYLIHLKDILEITG
jgi:hypothetical protein